MRPAAQERTVLSLAKMLSSANVFEINDIQEDEAEAALTRRSVCNNVALGRKELDGVFGKHYQWSRTHLALSKDAPESRAVEPPEQGRVVAIAQVGDYTTDISDAPLSRSKPVASMFAFLERKCRFSLIYPTKLLLIQNRILSRYGLPALGGTRGLGEAETASL